MENMWLFQIMIAAAVIAVFRLCYAVVVRPGRLRSALIRQGLRGPPPTFLLGNIVEMRRERKKAAAATAARVPGPPPSHNCESDILPFFERWKEEYGGAFVFSLGSKQILLVTEADMVKEISICTSLDLGKPLYQAEERGSLLGRGILTSNGAVWAHQRRILAPELYMDKVKGMIKLIQDSAMVMLNSWEKLVEEAGGLANIRIDDHMRSFSGDVISKACFGTDYSKGEQIFFKLRALQELVSKKVFGAAFSIFRYVPTKSNREVWMLEKEIKNLILNVVKQREKAGTLEKDLLQTLLEGTRDAGLRQEAANRFILDNCKNIYLAGYETTAVSAIWCLMLLASHPEWQDRVRSEVLDICQGRAPDSEMIRRMKKLTMVINESLRLYPPVSIVSREALEGMRFGHVNVPRGVNIWSLVTTLHTDPKNWGPDSYQFNPQRFANGAAGACKFPHLYMPFGVGPRVCLGQNLALVELKILVSMIVSRFSFSLSPKYVHSPSLNLVIEPGYGVDLSVKMI